MNSIYDLLRVENSNYFAIPETLYFRSLIDLPRDCHEIQIGGIEINYHDISKIQNIFLLRDYYNVWKISIDLLMLICEIRYNHERVIIIFPEHFISNQNLKGNGIHCQQVIRFGFSSAERNIYMKVHLKKIIRSNSIPKRVGLFRFYHEISFEKTDIIDISIPSRVPLNGLYLLTNHDWNFVDVMINHINICHWTKSLHSIYGQKFETWSIPERFLENFLRKDLIEHIYSFLPVSNRKLYWFPFFAGESNLSWNPEHFISTNNIQELELIFDKKITGKVFISGYSS